MEEEIIVPVTAILSIMIYKIAKLIFHPHAPRANKVEDARVAAMERRMAEMENRILTLQDLVIGGDFEVRRKLDQASGHLRETTPTASQMTSSASAPSVQTVGDHTR